MWGNEYEFRLISEYFQPVTDREKKWGAIFTWYFTFRKQSTVFREYLKNVLSPHFVGKMVIDSVSLFLSVS